MSVTMRIGLASAAVLLSSGCFVDPIGSLTTSTVDTSGAPALTSTSGSSTSSTGSTGLDPTSTGATSTGADTTGPASTTGPPPPCTDQSFKQIVAVADAEVVAPMTTMDSEEGLVAYSELAEMGSVRFVVDLPCTGQYAVWGRVLDNMPSSNPDDPDSYYVAVDVGADLTWFYGCQTLNAPVAYRWQRVHLVDPGQTCMEIVPWTIDLSGGPHAITLRNREPINADGHVARIARLLITNDLAYVPTDDD